jgi:cell division protein FtsQ
MPKSLHPTSPHFTAAARWPRTRARRTWWQRFATRPPPGVGLILTFGLFASSALYGAQLGGQWPVLVATYGTPAEMVTNALGFQVATVTITGQRDLTDAEILAAAGVTATTSLLLLDAEEARQQLLALPLVKAATVHKLYPATLGITLEEREPFALWQHEGVVSVVARDGTAIDRLRDGRFARLPFVVGEGAAARATEIQDLLARVPDLRARVRASVLVAQRRWNLTLDNGVVVRLPEHGPDRALTALAEMQAKEGIIDRDILAIDMRIADRIALRLGADAVAARAEAAKKKKKAGAA